MTTVIKSMAVRTIIATAVFVALATFSSTAFAGPTRIEFDERLIQGQTKKANSIYIFKRQQSEIRSLVKRSRSFRKRIVLTVFDEQ